MTAERRIILMRAGLASSLLVLLCWCMSLRWAPTWTGETYRVAVESGRFTIETREHLVNYWFTPAMVEPLGWSMQRPERPIFSEGFSTQHLRLSTGFIAPSVRHRFVEWYLSRPPTMREDIEVVLPMWPLFVFVAVPTMMLFWRQRWRYEAGFCRSCGYDIRFSAGGKCPECGKRLGVRDAVMRKIGSLCDFLILFKWPALIFCLFIFSLCVWSMVAPASMRNIRLEWCSLLVENKARIRGPTSSWPDFTTTEYVLLPWLMGAMATAGLLFLLPVLFTRTDSTWARRCHACGYNLTGNKTGICPECGARTASGSGTVVRR